MTGSEADMAAVIITKQANRWVARVHTTRAHVASSKHLSWLMHRLQRDDHRVTFIRDRGVEL